MAGATRHEKKMKKLRINTMTKDEEWREREREREARLGNCACSTSLEEHGPAICLRNEPSILLRTGGVPGGGRGCNESKRNGCWKFRCGAERRRRGGERIAMKNSKATLGICSGIALFLPS